MHYQTRRSTKKSCRILSRKAPKRVEYDDAIKQQNAISATDGELSSPHEWPPYGGMCWVQAYDEARAWNALLLATQLWAYAQSTSYMPQAQKDAFFVAYTQAKQNYGLAWQVMEDCMTGMIV